MKRLDIGWKTFIFISIMNLDHRLLRKGALLLFFSIVWHTHCATTQAARLNPEEYEKYTWNQKVDFFQKRTGIAHPDDLTLYRKALSDPYPLVTTTALDSMSDELSVIMRDDLYTLLKHKNSMIRWKSCKNISRAPQRDDLRHLSRLFSDKEWLARECSCRSVRSYPDELKEKKYFFRLISLLNEKNPNVLKELYVTLKWYEDPRTFPYLFKRSFHADTSIELITILRELASYPGAKVTRRLRQLAKYHPDFFVREEAERLLKGR